MVNKSVLSGKNQLPTTLRPGIVSPDVVTDAIVEEKTRQHIKQSPKYINPRSKQKQEAQAVRKEIQMGSCAFFLDSDSAPAASSSTNAAAAALKKQRQQ